MRFVALNIESTDDLINTLSFLIAKETQQGYKNETFQPYIMPPQNFKIGQVSATYTTGRPQIIFEGETTESLKVYPYLASYTPLANDWVLLVNTGNTYIILGAIV